MMAITTREDAIICLMQKFMVGTDRALAHAAPIASDRITTALEKLVDAIVEVSKEVCDSMEETGTHPCTPESGGCK